MIRDMYGVLDELRQAEGISLREWAIRAGVHKNVLSYLRRGNVDIRLGTLLRVAEGVGCNLNVRVRARRVAGLNAQRPAGAGRQVEQP